MLGTIFKVLYKGSGGSENFFTIFRPYNNSLAFERMSGQVSTCSRSPKSSHVRMRYTGGIYIDQIYQKLRFYRVEGGAVLCFSSLSKVVI